MFSFSPGVACFNRSVYQRYSAPQPRISPRASCGRRRCPTMGPFVAVRRSSKRHGMPSQWPSASNAPPACGPCDPTAILPPGPTPSAAPRQFHLRPADTTRRSVFSDFAVPSVRVCQSGVPAAGHTPARSPAPQPIPLSDDQFRQSPTELVQHVALDRIRHVFDEDLAPQRPAAGLQPSRGAGLSPIMVSLRPAPVAFAHRIRLREVDNRGQCRCRPSWRYEPITPTA